MCVCVFFLYIKSTHILHIAITTTKSWYGLCGFLFFIKYILLDVEPPSPKHHSSIPATTTTNILCVFFFFFIFRAFFYSSHSTFSSSSAFFFHVCILDVISIWYTKKQQEEICCIKNQFAIYLGAFALHFTHSIWQRDTFYRSQNINIIFLLHFFSFSILWICTSGFTWWK